jgi:F-type H+-transporting ATPase subunit epsilon
MANRSYALEIRSPERLIFEGEVSSIKAPGVEGNFQIMAGHIPFLTILMPGAMIIRTTDGDRTMATSGGLFEVLKEGVTALLDTVEWPDEIDIERAESSRQRAVERLASKSNDIDQIRAEAALTRALVRIRISGP